jgi:Domain of unknown function (DUF4124)
LLLSVENLVPVTVIVEFSMLESRQVYRSMCGRITHTAKKPKPRSRPDRSTGLAIVLSLLVVASASAQAIQEWKTPDGTLFFGDRPPAGSIRVGEVGSDSQPPEPVLSLKTFAAKASQSRNELEQALRRNSDRLWAIRDQLDKVESLKPKDDPEFVMSEQGTTDLAAFQARKAETLRRLREAERRSYSVIAGLWKSLDELNSKVASRYDGKPPDWWQDKVNCQNCATREEAEDALK